jgi:FkbM family methyltransferase
MMSRPVLLARKFAKHVLRPIRPFPDDFLKHVTGLIHVGANAGQERFLYRSHDVIWVEAIPSVFDELQGNIADFPRQQAINAVLADKESDWVEFNISSNEGLSSSLFGLKDHAVDHPSVTYVAKERLKTTTFAAMLDEHQIDLARFQALVLDVQGAEILVLKGASDLIRQFRYIKAEASDAELYAGGCLASDVIAYLAGFGFRLQRKVIIATGKDGKRTYDIIFQRA